MKKSLESESKRQELGRSLRIRRISIVIGGLLIVGGIGALWGTSSLTNTQLELQFSEVVCSTYDAVDGGITPELRRSWGSFFRENSNELKSRRNLDLREDGSLWLESHVQDFLSEVGLYNSTDFGWKLNRFMETRIMEQATTELRFGGC